MGIKMSETTHTEIEGTKFAFIPIIPFEKWAEGKMGMKKFDILSHKDKNKIFLRWKWGFEDDITNENLDMSEKASLYLFKDDDLNQLSEAWRFHIQHKRNFDRICYATKGRIGFITKNNPLIDKLVEEFDARTV